MKAVDLSSFPKRVDSVAVAQALLDEQNLEMLRCLMQTEWSVQELVNELHKPLAKTYYRLRKLERLGIVTCVRSKSRHGRVIRYYRILETHWFVPFEFTPASTPSELIASSFRPIFEQFLQHFGSLAERFTTPEVWGVTMQLKNHDLEFELSPPRPERHLTGPVLANWISKNLTRDQALQFETRLEALVAEFNDMPEEQNAPEHLLGVFLIEQPSTPRET